MGVVGTTAVTVVAVVVMMQAQTTKILEMGMQRVIVMVLYRPPVLLPKY